MASIASSSSCGSHALRRSMTQMVSRPTIRGMTTQPSLTQFPFVRKDAEPVAAERVSRKQAEARRKVRNYKAHEQAKNDSNLRLAIDLYHTAQHFYPTRSTYTGQAKVGLDQVNDEDAEALFPAQAKSYSLYESTVSNEASKTASGLTVRSLDQELDWIIRGHLIPKSPTNSRIGFTRSPVHMRTDAMLLDRVEETRTAFEKREQEPMMETSDRGGALDTLMAPASGSALSNYGARTAEPLPDVEDAEAVQRYIAEAARRAANQLRNPDGRAQAHEGLDSRSARLRDALFGTVQGSLPGLEVIRERARDPRVKTEAQRLVMEANQLREELARKAAEALEKEKEGETGAASAEGAAAPLA